MRVNLAWVPRRASPRKLLLAQCSLRQALRVRRGEVGPSSARQSSRPFSTDPSPTSLTQTDRAFQGWLPPITHGAGTLRAGNAGEEVFLSGWLLGGRKMSREHSFHPLRDSTGVVQLVIRSEDLVQKLLALPIESVVQVKGKVSRRPDAMINKAQNSGEIEVQVSSFTLLNAAIAKLPFQPSEEHHLPNEEVRAKHRYLDLRRPDLTEIIRLRSRVAHRIRCCLHDQGFTEVETPLLLRSTPEGAREFLVPTRVSAIDGSSAQTYFALPQSPQQPKQLLMASGVTDKYFQIAKCFRDEAGRKDRQPEFTQIDMEMAFVDGAPPPSASSSSSSSGEWRIGGSQVRKTIESLIRDVWLEAKNVDVFAGAEDSFPVMTYGEAMSRFGSDKPDTRFGLEIVDLQDYVQSSDGNVSASDEREPAIRNTLEIMALRLPKTSVGSIAAPASPKAKSKDKKVDSPKTLSNADMKQLMADKSGAQAASRLERFKSPHPSPHVLARLLLQKSHHLRTYLQDHEDGWTADEVDVEKLAEGVEKALQVGSLTGQHGEVEEETHLFVSSRRDPPVGGSTEMGELRLRLRDALTDRDLLQLPTKPHFLWITEFPLLTQSDADKSELSGGRWSSTHHPFTSPTLDSLGKFEEILDRVEAATSESTEPIDLTTIVSVAELESIKGQHYDLVLDGVELGGGSVRIHDATLQRRLLSLCLQLTPAEVNRFDHLLSALASGCPPHAGIALGFDRLMALLATKDGEKTKRGIRDVIAFPKAGSGRDPLFGTPSTLSDGESIGVATK